MITLEILDRWLLAPVETEHLEFKEAKQQFDPKKLLRYCVALANEGGRHIVLGVSDKRPRQVVGSQAFLTDTLMNEIKSSIVARLRIRVELTELTHRDGRVLVFTVLARPKGQPMHFDGQ